MGFFKRGKQIIFVGCIVLLVLYGLWRKNMKPNPLAFSSHGNISIEEDKDEIMIYLIGEVMKPGVISMKPGDRLFQAVEKAGGLTDRADEKKINLSMKLKDEDKIIIPAMDDEKTSTVALVENPKININTATESELRTLTGIGEVMAKRIIEYRENHPFQSIEEIKNVSGIGDKTFENICEYITVE